MSENVPGGTSEKRIDRISSGIPGLDTVLGGGFLRGGTYIVMGPPGAGKTILGNQICFDFVARGGRAVYVTLLAESHARMLSHLSPLAFFDPGPIASSLTYVSAYRVLEQEGLAGLLELMRRLLREQRASLLVLDGLITAEEFAGSDLAFKKFIHELNTLLGVVGCTAFLLTNGTTRTICPEHTMVDGLVELSQPIVGLRAVRDLVVRKFRGSGFLPGRHRFDITDAGITVHPRLEAQSQRNLPIPEHDAIRNGFGVAELDAMFDGGLHRGSTTMLLGPSGAGKTMLGLTFLAAGARAGERVQYFGFYESPRRLVATGDGIGLAISTHLERGLLAVEWQPPLEQTADPLGEQVLRVCRERNVSRLFIDGLAGFEDTTTNPERLRRFFAAFTNELRAMGVTTLFSQETRSLFGPGIQVPIEGLSAVCENIVFLRQVEFRSSLRRVISIVKTRESAHDSTIREIRISGTGISVGGMLSPDADAILTGVVRTTPRRRGADAAAPKPSKRRVSSKASASKVRSSPNGKSGAARGRKG